MSVAKTFSVICLAYFPAVVKSESGAKFKREKPIEGMRCRAPSVAAPIVPEYKIFMLEFEPWFIPLKIKSGVRSRILKSAIFTQSAGEPEQGRLSGPGRTDQSCHTTLRNMKRYIRKNKFGYLFNLNHTNLDRTFR